MSYFDDIGCTLHIIAYKNTTKSVINCKEFYPSLIHNFLNFRDHRDCRCVWSCATLSLPVLICQQWALHNCHWWSKLNQKTSFGHWPNFGYTPGFRQLIWLWAQTHYLVGTHRPSSQTTTGPGGNLVNPAILTARKEAASQSWNTIPPP